MAQSAVTGLHLLMCPVPYTSGHRLLGSVAMIDSIAVPPTMRPQQRLPARLLFFRCNHAGAMSYIHNFFFSCVDSLELELKGSVCRAKGALLAELE